MNSLWFSFRKAKHSAESLTAELHCFQAEAENTFLEGSCLLDEIISFKCKYLFKWKEY